MRSAAALVESWLAFLNDGDVGHLAASHSPDFVDHDPFPGYPGTLDGTVAAAARLREGDVRLVFNLEDVVSAGDRVAYRVAGIGSVHDAAAGDELLETFALGCVGIFRVQDGALRERWGTWAYMPIERREITIAY
jgi:ketosteroid isomerase-like protein